MTMSAQLEDSDDGAPTTGDRLYALPVAIGAHTALLAALLATGGSLWMSEVWGWIPCELCWYQRIFMYPLTIVLLVGILRGDRRTYLTALPLAIVGALISTYHYLIQTTDIFPPPMCKNGISCATDYINIVGPLSFLKVPLFALTAFVIIIIFSVVVALFDAEDDAPQPFRWDAARVTAVATTVIVAGGWLIGKALA